MAAAKATPADGPSALNPDWNVYQLTLAAMIVPLSRHWLVDALAGAWIALLGHPLVGLLYALLVATYDALQQRVLIHCAARSATADPAAGLRRLAALTSLRMTVYVAPTLVLALTGGTKELVYLAIQLCTLIVLAPSTGALSRIMFWGFAGPLLVAAGALIAWLLPPVPALACAGSLAVAVIILLSISQSSYRTITKWHDAFNGNVGMLQELQAARDQAVAEREAADRAREDARQANRAKSNFLATMSHEIRTPMNGVLGMAQLLKREAIDADQSERLAVLIESGEHLLSILNDILDVSKIDAGRLQLITGPEDLRRFLEAHVEFWRGRADEKNLHLALTVDPSVPAVVTMDALRMRQVLFNLVGNALKFTDAGAVEIVAEARREGASSLVHIAVRDTGPGIAPGHMPVLFDRFSQADEAEMRRYGGTGLGLAIAKQLTELMGGRIWAESRLGAGSTFHLEFLLPLANEQSSAAPEPKLEAEPEPLLSGDLRLLCVDDNAVNLLVLDQLLSSLGLSVAKMASGPEALERLQTEVFDLVLMDIQMPGMSGVEVLERLLSAPGPNRETPVIALTADVTSGGRDYYLELGFADHASKPIQLGELTQAIARALAVADAPSNARLA